VNNVFTATINLKTVSEANSSEHWTDKHKRHKLQKRLVFYNLMLKRPTITIPCVIKLTRVSPRFLDSHDNLPCSFKFIVDSITNYIVPGKRVGMADSVPGITIEYDQVKGLPKKHSIIIEISC